MEKETMNKLTIEPHEFIKPGQRIEIEDEALKTMILNMLEKCKKVMDDALAVKDAEIAKLQAEIDARRVPDLKL